MKKTNDGINMFTSNGTVDGIIEKTTAEQMFNKAVDSQAIGLYISQNKKYLALIQVEGYYMGDTEDWAYDDEEGYEVNFAITNASEKLDLNDIKPIDENLQYTSNGIVPEDDAIEGINNVLETFKAYDTFNVPKEVKDEEPNANYTHVVYLWPFAGYQLYPFYVTSDSDYAGTVIALAVKQAIENGQKNFYYTEEELSDLTDEEKDENYIYFDMSEFDLPNVYIDAYNTKVYTKEEDPYKKIEEKAETEAPVEDNTPKTFEELLNESVNPMDNVSVKEVEDHGDNEYCAVLDVEISGKDLMEYGLTSINSEYTDEIEFNEDALETYLTGNLGLGELVNGYTYDKEAGIYIEACEPGDNFEYISYKKEYNAQEMDIIEKYEGSVILTIEIIFKKELTKDCDNTPKISKKFLNSLKAKDSYKVDFYVEGNLLEGRTENGFDTYKEAEDFAEDEIMIISQNGYEKEIPLEDITYEINYVRDFEEEE